jgi:hypothetical protein
MVPCHGAVGKYQVVSGLEMLAQMSFQKFSALIFGPSLESADCRCPFVRGALFLGAQCRVWLCRRVAMARRFFPNEGIYQSSFLRVSTADAGFPLYRHGDGWWWSLVLATK